MDTTPNGFDWPQGKRAAVSLSFDDARPSQIDVGMPILDSHGVRATFYVSLGALEQRIEQWRAAVAKGHEIGNHTLTHPCSANFGWAQQGGLEAYTLARMEDEFIQAGARIEQQLGVRCVTFAYPCGQKFVGRGVATQSYVPLVAKHFLAGRGFRDEAPNDPSVCDLAQLFGVDGDSQSFAELEPWIKKTIERGGWLILASHEVGSMARQTMLTETLDAICRFASDPVNGLWIDTVAAIAGYIQDARRVERPTAALPSSRS